MRQSIGATATFNIIIIFIVIVFGLLIGTVNYYKAFKVNSRILDIIEKYEGYNHHAYEEIGLFLGTMGYDNSRKNCPQFEHGGQLVSSSNGNHYMDSRYRYCVYYHGSDGNKNDPKGEETYYSYSVVTYITADLPFGTRIEIPVYTKGERIYKFG